MSFVVFKIAAVVTAGTAVYGAVQAKKADSKRRKTQAQLNKSAEQDKKAIAGKREFDAGRGRKTSGFYSGVKGVAKF